MARRIKWLNATVQKNHLERLIGQMAKMEYSESVARGFADCSFHGRSIEGRFIERFETVSTIYDPFNRKELELPRVDFQVVDFLIQTKVPNIELRDAPKSLATFFNLLAGFLDFSLSIEPITIEPIDWAESLNVDMQCLQVGSITLSDISLSQSVFAKAVLAGSEDVRGQIAKMVGKRTYTCEKASISGQFLSQAFKCELSNDARASISFGNEVELAAALKRALAAKSPKRSA